MEQALERYNGVLKQRSDLVGEVSSLHEVRGCAIAPVPVGAH